MAAAGAARITTSRGRDAPNVAACFTCRVYLCGLYAPSLLAELLHDLGGLLEGVIAGRRAAIGGLLQDDLLDVVGREPALGEGGAHVQAKLVPGAERHHGADHQDAAGALVEV